MAFKGFPQFRDGDVEIHFSKTDEKYVLHGHTLALHSSWFRASLSERWQAEQKAIVNGKNGWVFELRFDEGSKVGTLMSKANPGAKTEFIEGNNTEPAIGTVTLQKADNLRNDRLICLKAHQDMLGTLYYVQPHLNSSFTNKNSFTRALADVAKISDCEHPVKVHIKYHLNLHKDLVRDACARDPVGMLDLSMACKSDWGFKTAATNAIGCNKDAYDAMKLKLATLDLNAIISSKRCRFEETIHASEHQLFRIKPDINDVKDTPGYMAINFFRQWLADELDKGCASGLARCYAKIYHTIKKGYSAVQEDSDNTTYTRKFVSRPKSDYVESVEAEVGKIFEKAAKIMSPILRDAYGHHKSYFLYRTLTFIGIEDHELPWAKK